MGRNSRKTVPLGFQTGECWGDILNHPGNESARTEAARHIYKHGGKSGGPMVPRLMVKFEEIEKEPRRYAKALERIERAMSYGCEIELVVDWFNKADRRGDYHQYVYMPRDKSVKEHVRDLVRRVRPAQLEVCNEFWHTKGRDDMRMEDYTKLVYQYAEGCLMAGAPYPQLNASTKMDAQDSPHDLWVWDVEYDDCCEVYHRFIMDQREPGYPTRPNELEDYLNDQAHIERGRAIGWIWPLKCNETTFNGQHVDINSAAGAEMVHISLEHYKRHKYPATFLAMGGFQEMGDGGGWGLRVDFIDKHGNLSRGAERWLEIVGAPDFDDDDDDDIEPPGNGSALDAMKQADRLVTKSLIDWGSRKSFRRASRARNKIQDALDLVGWDR